MSRTSSAASGFAGPALLTAFVLVASVTVAAGVTGAEAAKARVDHMKGLGAARKALGEQLKSGAPDMAAIKLQAAKIDDGAKALPTWFPVGSGLSADPKSEVLPVVWTDRAGFQTKARTLAEAAAKLDAAAQLGDAAAVGVSFKAVGEACKGCHETFKAKDKT